jgi:hypothetical protein
VEYRFPNWNGHIHQAGDTDTAVVKNLNCNHLDGKQPSDFAPTVDGKDIAPKSAVTYAMRFEPSSPPTCDAAPPRATGLRGRWTRCERRCADMHESSRRILWLASGLLIHFSGGQARSPHSNRNLALSTGTADRAKRTQNSRSVSGLALSTLLKIVFCPPPVC